MKPGYWDKILDQTCQSESKSLWRTMRVFANILQLTVNRMGTQNRFSPGRILAITIGGIAMAEVFAMAVIYNVTNHGHPNHLSPNQTRQLFYIFREALKNIEKYANVSQAVGEFIWVEDSLTFVISDLGRGFDPDAVQAGDHYGLKFMRERAELLYGPFSVQSAAGQGTKITVSVPYEYENGAAL